MACAQIDDLGMKGAMISRVREVVSFLAVGGVGYVVDIGVFNLLWGTAPFDRWDPSIAKAAAVAAAMVVTYLGNSWVTWRGNRRMSGRQIAMFILSNLIGLGMSIVALWVSHDLLGLTSRLDDNLSGNVIGIGLGTLCRYWLYRRVVFAPEPTTAPDPGRRAGAHRGVRSPRRVLVRSASGVGRALPGNHRGAGVASRPVTGGVLVTRPTHPAGRHRRRVERIDGSKQ